MTIQIGDTLPDGSFTVMGNTEPSAQTVAEIFEGRKVLLFAVPGAFTPTCHKSHMPGYLEHLDEIRAKGVDQVACLAVNDVFVLDHWAKASGVEGRILVLADGSATFVRSLGLELDANAFGLGVRAQRFAMVVDNRVIRELAVEPDPTKVTVTGAEALLQKL